MEKEHLVIFDTTLRDGEQSPGASMTRDEKVRIAKMLEQLGVDVIEAGFAIASPGDFDAVKAVASAVKDSTICSLARANAKDIDAAGEALKGATSSRIHTFIATSPIHREHKLKLSTDQVVEAAVASIKHARRYTDNVEFSCEDASRTEFDFLCRIIEAVIREGARTINIPDTVGYGEPGEFGDTMGRLIENIPNADQAVFSVHCHNDLGLAVANSLCAVKNGARQVECTINGLGERAGNASLEEVVMAIHTRRDLFDVSTTIETRHIVPISRLVSGITGFPVQPNKAIVGANAFAHEAGIHQDGVLKHRETYEIMRAEDVGWQTNRLVLGKHSGRAAFKARLEALNIAFDDDDAFNAAFGRFKELADKKHEIYDEDLQALVSDVTRPQMDEKFELLSLEAFSKTGAASTAKLRIRVDAEESSVEATGDGPVDACFKALEILARSGTQLKLYSVNAITDGTDSQGDVTVRLEKDAVIVNGCGADTDIVIASVKAYLNALNILAAGPVNVHQSLGGV